MAIQARKRDVPLLLKTIRGKGVRAEVIGEINDDGREVFEYKGETVAVIPNTPSQADLKEISIG
jgi:phosphoribosylformylglycinamidine (FGAM) synthase-like enzyme